MIFLLCVVGLDEATTASGSIGGGFRSSTAAALAVWLAITLLNRRDTERSTDDVALDTVSR